MRNILVKLFIGTAITAIGMFGADSSAATWKFNAAKSKTTSTNPIKSQTDVREATPDGGVKVTRTGQLRTALPTRARTATITTARNLQHQPQDFHSTRFPSNG